MWELEAERYDPKPQNFDVQIERQETNLRTKRETFKIKEQKHLEMEMKYISGIHALNLRCSLETCGDWHASGIQWKNLTVRESSDSVFGDYGIEDNSSVPGHPGNHKAANHIRALLDLVADGAFGYAQGMKNELICNESYTPEVFSKLLLLKNSPRWLKIKEFIGKEYGVPWLHFLREHGYDR